jgi:hypothetical protein
MYMRGFRVDRRSLQEVRELFKQEKADIEKRLFSQIKSGTKGGNAGQWSARKAQLLARAYKKKGGGYKS